MFIEMQDPKVGTVVVNTKNLRYIRYKKREIRRNGDYYEAVDNGNVVYSSKVFTQKLMSIMDSWFKQYSGKLKWEVLLNGKQEDSV